MTSLAAGLAKIVQEGLTKTKAETTVNLLSDRPVLNHVSTGSVPLNWAIGPYCPGIPLGRISQAYGLEQGGKSRLMCSVLHQAQLAGYGTFLCDTENHYTPEWFGRFGGDIANVVDINASTLEELLQTIEFAANAVVQKGLDGGLVVVDSLQGVLPSAAKEADAAYAEGLGAVARVMSSRLTRVVDVARQSNVGIIFVGQARERIGTMHRGDNKYYTPGGNALTHASVLRLFMKFAGAITGIDGARREDRVGFISKVKTKKNNVGGRVPNYTVNLEFGDFGELDDVMALFDIATGLDIIHHRGGGHYESEHIPGLSFRGRDAWRTSCTPEIRVEVERLIFEPEFCLQQEATNLIETPESENVAEGAE